MALLTSSSNARRTEKRIGKATNISLPLISSLSATAPTTNTVNIPGIGLDAVVLITVQTPTNGVVVDAYVSAPSVVTIRQNNVTGASVATVAATKAQLQTFFR